MIWERVISVFSSIPFATLTMICPSRTKGCMEWDVPLVYGEGTASTSTSLSFTAASKSVVNAMSSGSFTPGSLSLCSCSLCSISISGSMIDQTVIL